MFALYINDMSVSGYKQRCKKGWGHKEAIFIPSDIAPETIQQGDYPLTVDRIRNSLSKWFYLIHLPYAPSIRLVKRKSHDAT